MNTGNAHIGQRSVDDERLDSVIDAVAREMTEAEPSGALRARVLEQIGRGRRQPLPALRRWAWAGAATAVVLAVATGVWVLNRPLRPSEEPARFASSRPAARPETPVVTEPAETVPMPPLDARPPGRSTRGSASPVAKFVESDAVADAHHVPALAEIDPLRFTAVEPAPLAIDAVEVTPFPAIPTIEISSLGPGSNDNQSTDPDKEK
jgi:hypothetical protein